MPVICLHSKFLQLSTHIVWMDCMDGAKLQYPVDIRQVKRIWNTANKH